MEKSRYNRITSQFHKRTVLVIGDLMLDKYLWGHTDRISPEAPVPIVEVNNICLLYTSPSPRDRG